MNTIRNRNFRAGTQTSLEGFICHQNSDKQQKIKVFGRSRGAILAELFVRDYVFVLNAVIAICVPTICAKIATDSKNSNYVFLRKMSIMIYFIHFVPVTVFHVLADKHLIPYEYGAIEFLVVFALASVCAGIIVWASNKYKILKYLY